MKNVYLIILIIFVFNGCTGKNSSEAMSSMVIPILLPEDDSFSNGEHVLSSISNRIYKNSLYESCVSSIENNNSVCLDISFDLNSQSLSNKEIIFKYIKTGSSKLFITKKFPLFIDLENRESRFVRAYFLQAEKESEVNVVKFKQNDDNVTFEERELVDLGEIINNINEELKNNEDLNVSDVIIENYGELGIFDVYSYAEIKNIEKDLLNIHNVYVPYRMMKDR